MPGEKPVIHSSGVEFLLTCVRGVFVVIFEAVVIGAAVCVSDVLSTTFTHIVCETFFFVAVKTS